MNGLATAQRITYLRRMKSDREHLYDRLGRIGFVPDKDMREQLSAIRAELGKRIDEDRNELMELETDVLEALVK